MMKRCPKCNLPSSSDENSFCEFDGTPLISDPNYVFPPSPVRNGVSPFFAYVAIALVALIAGGGVVAWYKSGPEPAAVKTPAPGNASPVPAATAPTPVQPSKYMPFSPGLYQVVNTKGPSDPLFIRPAPADFSRSNGSIPLGDTVQVMDNEQKRDKKGNVWVYVIYQGTTGWVHSRYLKRL